ncbi:Serine/threonine/tyrosine-interacting protein [Paramyrothecium foliicola]|nr:Serine/threonine/tyrosine-interacting protein [Paramyrothecium foliicola]
MVGFDESHNLWQHPRPPTEREPSYMPAALLMHPPISKNVIAAAPYERHRPNPPFIPVPNVEHHEGGRMKLVPSLENIDLIQLTPGDLEMITQNKFQVAKDGTLNWAYEQRRQAQSVLDYLYLGPTSIIRDQAFLQREGITMIVIARHASLASQRLMSVERVSEQLGIHVHYVDVASDYQLVRGFPTAIRLVNDHMLAAASNSRRGKVLVACDSGNDRSAALVASYIMAMFGRDMWSAIGFISMQRFCCTFTEDLKRMLLTWQDMLKARSAVANARRTDDGGPVLRVMSEGAGNAKAKRGFDDMMDMDEEESRTEESTSDRDRFVGRDGFAPFVDQS